MGKLCIRCGHERQPTNVAPEGECPACGVIYARVEGGGPAAQSASQTRVARASVRHRQAQEADAGSFVAFRTMYTPILVRVAFLLAVVAGVSGAIIAVMQEQFLTAGMAVFSIVLARLALEGIAIVFRMADDLSAVRTLLAEQALDAARQQTEARS